MFEASLNMESHKVQPRARFLLYLNELPEACEKTKLVLFAHDTAN